MNYGITNSSGQVGIDEALKILKTAKKMKIKYLDTASSYGVSEQVLGKAGEVIDSFNIVSKFPKIEHDSIRSQDIESWDIIVNNSIRRLNLKKLDSILLHEPSDLRKPGGDVLLDWIISLKKRGITKRIGISIYNRACLKDINLEMIDIIQLPLSLYDQRLSRDGTIDNILENGIAIHARSIFLQGLLLARPTKWPSWVNKNTLSHHISLCDEVERKGCSLINYAIDFIKNQEYLEAAIFGICSLSELNALSDAWSSKENYIESGRLGDWALNDIELLDPRGWPKKS